MAPEQAIGFAVPASDIYSLAKILPEMPRWTWRTAFGNSHDSFLFRLNNPRIG